MNITDDRCIIVGAGIAGLLAARVLTEGGLRVTVLDKSRGVGGRMATRRFRAGTFDHGAQFFTVRDDRIQAYVEDWQRRGLLEIWARGFASEKNAEDSAGEDGHPRFRGVPGMTAVPKSLAQGLEVRLETEAVSIRQIEDGWQVNTNAGGSFQARRLILTPPIPQSLALLDAGGFRLPEGVRPALEGIRYDPCIALLVIAGGPGRVPAPGAIRFEGGVIRWIADNRQKGISATHAFTIHTSPEFSRAYWDAADSLVARQILQAAAAWLGRDILAWQVQRWRYSRPQSIHPDLCLPVGDRFRLIFAGDAFGGPRVEGAALSGLAAADLLLEDQAG